MAQEGEKHYNTNLASEYYILSMLHRQGFNPLMTLGNKKAIDIVISKGKELITIDVKSMESKTNWLLGNSLKLIDNNHFFILVTFLNRFKDFSVAPECYIIPSCDISSLIKQTKKGLAVSYFTIKGTNKNYLNNWQLLA